MARKSRSKKVTQSEYPAGAEPATIAEVLAPTAERLGLPDPQRQLTDARERKELIDTPREQEPEKKGPGDTEITPSPERNGKHVEKHRPDGPRKRDGEPAASYQGRSVRVIKDGQMWQVTVERDLTAEEYGKMQASGFTDVSDTGRIWNASQKELVQAGTDINIVAIQLDAKGERIGRAR